MLNSETTDQKITEFDIDMLCEIGNIGAGHAASALSVMLNQRISIEITFAKLCSLNSIPEQVGGPEAIRNVTYNEVHNSLEGYIFFILDDKDVETICNIAAKGYEIDNESVIVEVTNIITGSYVGALSEMIDESINQNIPRLKREKLGPLINSVIENSASEMADKTLVIGTSLIIRDLSLAPDIIVEDFHISGLYVMTLKQKSLDKLLERFNAGRK